MARFPARLWLCVVCVVAASVADDLTNVEVEPTLERGGRRLANDESPCPFCVKLNPLRGSVCEDVRGLAMDNEQPFVLNTNKLPIVDGLPYHGSCPYCLACQPLVGPAEVRAELLPANETCAYCFTCEELVATIVANGGPLGIEIPEDGVLLGVNKTHHYECSLLEPPPDPSTAPVAEPSAAPTAEL
mmetsp:Transcript_25104/g.75407  ORF Transcript_25104/g.75407 Transcript_25104/m.75407 type:complete len:187 (-) Transcript_25104:93-653(-)